MDEHTKHRLTGAAIVVALLVLLVPEMFRGRPPAAPPPATGSASGPPVRSYTIDLRPGAGANPKPEAPPATSSQPALAAPPVQAPTAATGVAPVATPEAAAAPPIQAADTAAPAGATTRATAPAPAAADKSTRAADGDTAGAERYQVQLGLFASRANAERLAAKVVRQGVRVAVSGPDARGLYRVHTATYATRDEAQAMQQKLRDLGLNAALTPQR